MSTYRIDEFKLLLGNVERPFARQGVANYINGNNNVKHINEFLCEPNAKINKVAKIAGGVVQEIFTIGDNVQNFGTITRIDIGAGNDCILRNGSATIRLINAIKTNPNSSTKKGASAFSDILAKIEKSYPSIRLEKTLKKSIPDNPKDFLIKFFKKLNDEKATIFVDSKGEQTEAGARRSLGDVYQLTKYYFPTVTLKQVIDLLYTELPKIITDGFRTSYCYTINRRVWYYEGGSRNEVLNKEKTDEFGHKYNNYV